MDTFREAVFKAVAMIPKGRVASYGQVAQMAGYSEGAARPVGNALHTNTDSVRTPCHRVVTSSGQMGSNYGFGGPELQRSILKTEGVKFIGDRVDMSQSGIVIEDHPLIPFLPANATILFLGSSPPAPSAQIRITIDGRQIEWWRMPSTSRAYPMSLQSKAAAYRQLFPMR